MPSSLSPWVSAETSLRPGQERSHPGRVLWRVPLCFSASSGPESVGPRGWSRDPGALKFPSQIAWTRIPGPMQGCPLPVGLPGLQSGRGHMGECLPVCTLRAPTGRDGAGGRLGGSWRWKLPEHPGALHPENPVWDHAAWMLPPAPASAPSLPRTGPTQLVWLRNAWGASAGCPRGPGPGSVLEGKSHVREFLTNKKGLPQGCWKSLKTKKAFRDALWPQSRSLCSRPLCGALGLDTPWVLVTAPSSPRCLFSCVCTECGISHSDRKVLWTKSVLPGRGALVGVP